MLKRLLVSVLAFAVLLLITACLPFEDEEFYSEEEGFLEEDEEAFDEREVSEGFTETDCPVDIPREFFATCGFVAVPENRQDPATELIELAIVIAEPEGGPRIDIPIVYLAGGPGGSGLLDFADDPDGWTTDVYPFLADQTLILVDQRGTGFSRPTLNCPEIEFSEDEDATFAAEECYNRLINEGIDLPAYNNDENAADIADIVDILGYEQVDLWGISYGTRLGLGILRDHPEVVRSAVLDSVFPHEVNAPLEEWAGDRWVLDRVFEACEAEFECAEAYPDLEEVYLETVQLLDEEPLEDIDGFTVDGTELVTVTSSLLQDTVTMLVIPRMIYDLNAGDVSSYNEAIEIVYGEGFRLRQDGEDRTDSEGLFNTIICRDEFSFVSFDEAEAQAEAELGPILFEPYFGNTANQYEVCELWQVGAANAIENQPVSSDVPVLLLAGTFDTATPPYWTEDAGATLSNSTYVEIPNAGHSVTGTSDCAIAIMTSFIANPQATPDTACVSEQFVDFFFLPDEDIFFE